MFVDEICMMKLDWNCDDDVVNKQCMYAKRRENKKRKPMGCSVGCIG